MSEAHAEQPEGERQPEERHEEAAAMVEGAGADKTGIEVSGMEIKPSSSHLGILTALMIAGVVFGVAGGLLARHFLEPLDKRQLMYVAFPGDIFMRLLRQAVLPLVTASIVAAIGTVDIHLAGRMGKCALLYFMASTLAAEALGIVLVTSIEPGYAAGQTQTEAGAPQRVFLVADAVLDIIRNLVPPNIVEACLYMWSTKLKVPDEHNGGDLGNWTADTADFSIGLTPGTNIIGLLTCAVILGIILASHRERYAPLLDVFLALSDAMLVFIRILMWYAPLGICFLIAHRILATPDLYGAMVQLGMYMITVCVGLAVHVSIVLPMFYAVLVGPKSICRFVGAMVTPALTAIGTSSSSATIPATITALEDRMGLDPRVVRFVIPIGATVNMDGAALYEAVSAIFLAQRRGMELDAGRLLAVSLTATLASVGAAGMPGGGLATMVMMLESVGIPPEDVSIIATVDWLLDRFRTVVNVMGDAVGSSVVNALCKKELLQQHQKAV